MNLIVTVFLPLLTAIFAGPLLKGKAYLDPGSGSFILQILIATLVGGLFILKTFWQRVQTFFRSLFSRNKDDQEE
jgi:hypothetical protein